MLDRAKRESAPPLDRARRESAPPLDRAKRDDDGKPVTPPTKRALDVRDFAREKRDSAGPRGKRDSARPLDAAREKRDFAREKRESGTGSRAKRPSARSPVAYAPTDLSEDPRPRPRPEPAPRSRPAARTNRLALAAAIGVVGVVGAALAWRIAARGSSQTTDVPGPQSDLLERRLVAAENQLADGQSDACLETLAAADLASHRTEVPYVKLRARCAMASGDCDAARDVADLMSPTELDDLRKSTSCSPLDGDGPTRIAALRKLAEQPALWDRRCGYIDREMRALVRRPEVAAGDRSCAELATRALRCWGRLGKCKEARSLLDASRLALVPVRAMDVPECKLSDPPSFALDFLRSARSVVKPLHALAAARFELAYARLQIPEIAFEAAQAYAAAFEAPSASERRGAYRARAIALFKVYRARRSDGDLIAKAAARQHDLDETSPPPASAFAIVEPSVDPELDRALDFPSEAPCENARIARNKLLECAFLEQRPAGLTAPLFESNAGEDPAAACVRFETTLLRKLRELGCE